MPDLLLSLGSVPLRSLSYQSPARADIRGWGCGADADCVGGHYGGDGWPAGESKGLAEHDEAG